MLNQYCIHILIVICMYWKCLFLLVIFHFFIVQVLLRIKLVQNPVLSQFDTTVPIFLRLTNPISRLVELYYFPVHFRFPCERYTVPNVILVILRFGLRRSRRGRRWVHSDGHDRRRFLDDVDGLIVVLSSLLALFCLLLVTDDGGGARETRGLWSRWERQSHGQGPCPEGGDGWWSGSGGEVQLGLPEDGDGRGRGRGLRDAGARVCTSLTRRPRPQLLRLRVCPPHRIT